MRTRVSEVVRRFCDGEPGGGSCWTDGMCLWVGQLVIARREQDGSIMVVDPGTETSQTRRVRNLLLDMALAGNRKVVYDGR